MTDDFDQQDVDEWAARLRSHPSYKRDWTPFPDAGQHQIKNSRTVSSYDEAMAFVKQDNPMQDREVTVTNHGGSGYEVRAGEYKRTSSEWYTDELLEAIFGELPDNGESRAYRVSSRKPANPLQEYKLQRATGPLTFEGQLLSEATTPESQAGHERRAFRLALYRAKSGRLVAEFAYTSGWKTETPVFDAEAFDANVTGETLTDWFEEAAGIDPESGNIGCIKGVVPGTDHWKERNERIQALLRDEFDRCLSVVLDLPMFEERV